MGKRSTFPRIPQDSYPTPAEAVAPLLPHLEPGSRFFEPCAGEGWLMIDAGWVHTRQSQPYLPRLRTIVSVGRVKWVRDSPFTSKDDCAWHLFDRLQPDGIAITHFIGRADARRAA
jgi:hypothetical protein